MASPHAVLWELRLASILLEMFVDHRGLRALTDVRLWLNVVSHCRVLDLHVKQPVIGPFSTLMLAHALLVIMHRPFVLLGHADCI